eukprot:gene9827-2149_t
MVEQHNDHWTFYGYTIITPLALFLPLLFCSGVAFLMRVIIERKKFIQNKKIHNIIVTLLILVERILFMIVVYLLSSLLILGVSLDEIHTLFGYLVIAIVQLGLFHAFRYDSPKELEDEENEEVYEPMTETKETVIEKLQNLLLFYPAAVYNGMKRYSKSFILVSFLLLIVNAFILISLSGACFCLYPIEVSTSLSRIILGSSCNDGEICMLYLNVGENTNTEMIVKFHTKLPFTNHTSVYFDTNSHIGLDYPKIQSCFSDDLRDIITDETRYIHTCFLTNLTASTEYYFRVGDTNTLSKEKKFKTGNEGENVIIASGDVSPSDTTRRLIQEAAKHSPTFFMIGGDLFYTNGMNTCYQRLDKFFKLWEELAYTPEGHYIPLLTSIGNHEAKDFQFFRTRKDAQLYIRSFSYKNGDYGQSTSLHHAHTIGNHSSIMVLDSSVVESHSSQVDWLTKMWSEKYKSTNKYTLYHAPLYPSARSPDNAVSALGREHWLKIFDENNLKVSFENHDHLLKRTKFLKNNKEDITGTIYIGDGSLGTPRSGSIADMPWYLTTRKISYHYWVATMNKNYVNLKAKDENNIVQDELTINF